MNSPEPGIASPRELGERTDHAAAVGAEYPTGRAVLPPEQLPGRASSPPLRDLLLRAPATYLLLAINIGVFVWMVLHGVSLQSPNEISLLRYGANNAYFVVQLHQWWRIITAMFVHVGLLHLLTNMWCLWNLGLLGEPLLGFFGMLAVYVLTGAAGNLLSVATDVVYRNFIVGAGASGAVFGIAGILIVLLSNRRLAEPRRGNLGVPLAELHALRRSVINFAGINLLIGIGSEFQSFLPIHIDNRAHLGGFLFGLLLGAPLLSAMTLGRSRYLGRQRLVFGGGALLLAIIAKFVSKLG